MTATAGGSGCYSLLFFTGAPVLDQLVLQDVQWSATSGSAPRGVDTATAISVRRVAIIASALTVTSTLAGDGFNFRMSSLIGNSEFVVQHSTLVANTATVRPKNLNVAFQTPVGLHFEVSDSTLSTSASGGQSSGGGWSANIEMTGPGAGTITKMHILRSALTAVELTMAWTMNVYLYGDFSVVDRFTVEDSRLSTA